MTGSGKQHPDPTRPDLGPLQEILGHRFANPALLDQARTHAGAVSERARSNERLEFLGDRVLGLVAADMVMRVFPDEPEGKLGYRFSALVRRKALARVADDIGLGAFIVLAQSDDEAGGRQSEAILANTLEAVIAALFLDGGLDAAHQFIDVHWRALLSGDAKPPKDAKTQLQEWTQKRGLGIPTYTVVGRDGPDHAPHFTVEAAVGGLASAKARGGTKQAAEQAAAETLLRLVQSEP